MMSRARCRPNRRLDFPAIPLASPIFNFFHLLFEIQQLFWQRSFMSGSSDGVSSHGLCYRYLGVHCCGRDSMLFTQRLSRPSWIHRHPLFLPSFGVILRSHLHFLLLILLQRSCAPTLGLADRRVASHVLPFHQLALVPSIIRTFLGRS